MDDPSWRKSSRSGDWSNCVEIAALPDGTGVRDSKAPAVGHFQVPHNHWSSFLSRLKAGHYDL